MPDNIRNNLKKENLLSSWKEIAAYLDCDVRTCHRWEKVYGLPIHRMSESSKARVFTTKEELDLWLLAKKNSKFDFNQRQFYSRLTIPKKWSRILALFVLLVLIAVVFFIINRPFLKIGPADFSIDDSTLIVRNEKGIRLWRHDTGVESLVDEASYRKHFQIKGSNKGWGKDLPHLIIKDIDSDGFSDVLFSIQTQGELREGKLLCFNYEGTLMWTFEAGREIKFGKKVYSPDFRIKGFDVVDLDDDGFKEIVVISRHKFFFPNQVVVLDHRGNVKGEYWNSGYLLDYAFEDFDEDGKKDLVFSGLNNEYQTGCVVVFDNFELSGASPQYDDYFTGLQLSKGSEKHYILLPRIEWTLEDSIYETASSLEVLQNRRISVSTRLSSIYYEFDFNGHLLDIRLSDGFKLKYNEAFETGAIDFDIDEAFKQGLAERVLYHDGGRWTPVINRVEKRP